MPPAPNSAGASRGGRGLRHLRANGQPRGGPWRQGHGTACPGACLEPPGPLCHGTQAAGELIGRVVAGLAQGGGIRAPARVVAGEPNPVWPWRVEAAEQRRAFASSGLCALHGEPVPLEEGAAVWRARHTGASSDDEALKRRARPPSWGWPALAPKSQRFWVGEGGPRPLGGRP